MPKLYLMLKDKVVSEAPLEKSVFTVGRAPGNDLVIDNLAVSGFHAKIVNDNGIYAVEDLNSTNGTFVNDRRVSRIQLKNNDVITVGKHALIFSDPRGADDPDATVYARRGAKEKTVMMSSKIALAEAPPPQAARSAEGALGSFTVVSGPAEKRDYKLAGRLTTIGKSRKAEIRLKGFFAPRVAALVTRTREGYFISPPGGGRTVQVNGAPVAGSALLKDGDTVDAWKVKLHFHFTA